jgi:Putative zinc-finger
VSCDEVRELLPEHLLGTLDEPTDFLVRRHLRGCAGCRGDMSALAEGISTFARAAHEVTPPEELHDRVLSVLRDDWVEAAPAARPVGRPVRWAAWAAAFVLLAGSMGWGVWSNARAGRYEASASKYEQFLGALGGENVRVGSLRPASSQELEGSVVLYDSKVEQSWVLVLVRAPGVEGEASVTLSSPDGHTIDMHPLQFGAGGEASSWLVTSSNLKRFDGITVRDSGGTVIATGAVRGTTE